MRKPPENHHPISKSSPQALGAPAGSLLNTHRLDAGTEGVVVLARSQAFAAAFSKLLRDKTHCLRKTYRCLTAQPPPGAAGPASRALCGW